MIIRHLPYFAVAAEEENLQRAALRLGVSQPALSRRIRDLENELGLLLFERVSGRLKLTKYGSILGREARRIIDDVNVLERSLRGHSSDGAARLSIGMNERAISLPAVAKALRKFRADNPTVTLSVKIISSARQQTALKENQINIAFMYYEDEGAQFRAAPIRSDDRFMLVIPVDHDLAGEEIVSLAQIADEDLIWPSRDRVPSNYNYLMEKWYKAGLQPRISTEVTNSDAAIQAVRAGLGLALLRSSTLHGGFDDVCFLPIEEFKTDHLCLSAVWIEQHSNPVIRRFLRLLADFDVIDPQDLA